MASLRDQESLRFLMTLGSRDPSIRSQAFDTISQNIDALISSGYGSPVPPVNSEISDFQNDLDIKLSKVQEKLPDFLRIIHSCPFKDLSEKAEWLLEDLQVRIRFYFIFCTFYLSTLINNGPVQSVKQVTSVSIFRLGFLNNQLSKGQGEITCQT